MAESTMTELPSQQVACSCGCCGPQQVSETPIQESERATTCDCGCAGSGCTCGCDCCP